MKWYGVGNHTPFQFLDWLKASNNPNKNKVTIVPVTKKLKPSAKYKKIICFITYGDFVTNLKIIKANPETFASNTFVVFASPFKLDEHEGMTLLDCARSEKHRGIGFSLYTDFSANEFVVKGSKVELPKNRSPYLPKLVNNVFAEKTLLASLMTVIYTIKGSVNQKPVSLALATWLYEGGDESELDEILNYVKTKHKVIGAIQLKLKTILLSDMGRNIQAAFAQVREWKDEGKGVTYSSLERDFGVSAYDIRYLMNTLKNAKHNSKFERKPIDELTTR